MPSNKEATTRKRPAQREISPPISKRRKRALKEVQPDYREDSAEEIKVEVSVKTKKTVKKSRQVKTEINGTETNGVEVSETSQIIEKTTTKRKRKTKEEKEAESMPLAARTIGSKLLVGAHVSGAGGAHNAITNCVRIGGNALALFLKSQRQWAFKPLSDEHQTLFLSHCKDHQYGTDHHTVPPIVPHGSYLVNLAHTAPDRTKQAYESFIDDLSRCNKMGIRLYNFHPGNASGADSRQEALKHLAKQLNKSHNDEASGNVITLLETMAAFGGNTIGATFEEIAEIIKMVDNKDRVGVCLDTCHIFAAGYDLRTPEAFKETMDKFDRSINLKYLRALHVNDSKAPLGSGRDLHANIGTGFLGLRSFWNLVNEKRLWGLPFILETPMEREDTWAREIKLLESLVGMDPECDEFKDLEKQLSDLGKAERDKVQEQVDKRKPKKSKKSKKPLPETDEEDD